MLKKLGMNFFIIFIAGMLLTACSLHSQQYKTTKKNEYVAMLLDPDIKKDYRALKAAAADAKLYEKNGRTYFAEEDLQKINALSAGIVNRLQYSYHLDPARHRIHTYIGKNELNSCYQYYNSMHGYLMGSTCQETGSCSQCNYFLKKMRSKPSLNMVHLEGWNGKNTVLVNTIQLKNGDAAYVGLEVSQ